MVRFITILVLILVASKAQSSENLSKLWLEEFRGLSIQGVLILEKKCVEDPYYCYILGRFFEYKNEIEKSQELYRKACAREVSRSCLFLGYSLERQGKEEEASEKYFFACHKYKDADTCIALGQNFREANQWEKSFNYFKQACEIDPPKGCYEASEMALFKGDRKGQRTWYLRKGCDQSHGLSCWSLAQLQESKGYLHEAKEAYKKACLKDFSEACDKFKELNKGGFFKEYEAKYLRLKNEIKDWLGFWFEEFFPLDNP